MTCVYAKVIISLRQPLPSSLGPSMISPASASMDGYDCQKCLGTFDASLPADQPKDLGVQLE